MLGTELVNDTSGRVRRLNVIGVRVLSEISGGTSANPAQAAEQAISESATEFVEDLQARDPGFAAITTVAATVAEAPPVSAAPSSSAAPTTSAAPSSSPKPSQAPPQIPSAELSRAPTKEPTKAPSNHPTEAPSKAPAEADSPTSTEEDCQLLIPILDWIPFVSDAVNSGLCFFLGPDGVVSDMANMFGI